ncbi:hypothetical protein L1887_10791 [Cichorium endivia]|nr:hypothetical protein L1887_10791 [Cichorium endivia]
MKDPTKVDFVALLTLLFTVKLKYSLPPMKQESTIVLFYWLHRPQSLQFSIKIIFDSTTRTPKSLYPYSLSFSPISHAKNFRGRDNHITVFERAVTRTPSTNSVGVPSF